MDGICKWEQHEITYSDKNSARIYLVFQLDYIPPDYKTLLDLVPWNFKMEYNL